MRTKQKSKRYQEEKYLFPLFLSKFILWIPFRHFIQWTPIILFILLRLCSLRRSWHHTPDQCRSILVLILFWNIKPLGLQWSIRFILFKTKCFKEEKIEGDKETNLATAFNFAKHTTSPSSFPFLQHLGKQC